MDTYQILRDLPPRLLNDDRAAIVLPVFFWADQRSLLESCNSLASCAKL